MSAVASAFSFDAPAQACADFRVRERLAALDLGLAFLDFTHESIVVIDETLDRLADQLFGSHTALLRQARQPGVQLRR